GLVNVLNSPGSFTVFAPTNDAFSAFLGAAGFASVDDVPVPVLTQILLNHVVAGTVQSSQLSTGYVSTLATFNGVADGSPLSLYVNTSNGVRLNGVSTVTMPNILASNGIVHVVDAVIGLPTVVTFATADPTFSTLVAALTELTPATDFATVLSGAGPFTVFAPTNAAFDALDAELAPGGIAGLDETTLTNVLNYHVASGNVRSSALTPNGNTVVETLLTGNNFTITLPGTGGNIANVTDGAGRPDIGIIAVDVQAANGVIHVLNKVLLP
ncbi:MAG: fasciclin domain-containing protein, partial [Flavobacterium sp.]